jgi:threonine/homoserine/homoserine lactone efflux protein
VPIDQQLLGLFTVTTLIAMITPGPDMLFDWHDCLIWSHVA